MTLTVAAALAAGAGSLATAGVEDAGRDARRLMAAALGVAPDRLTLAMPEGIAGDAAARFEDFVARRASRVPVSRIVGGREFGGHWFGVTPHVLDPRPETEALVETALGAPFGRVLDLGVGSGCILISLLAARRAATGVGVDLTPETLATASANAEAVGVSDRCEFAVSDWFGSVEGVYDLIVSNPPYVTEGEMAELAPEARDHDPRTALAGGGDGLDAYRAIAARAGDHLAPDGRLLLEIAPWRRGAVLDVLAAAGLDTVGVHPDMDGRDRVVSARAP